MTETAGAPQLTGGRLVNLLPRSGGQARAGTVQDWLSDNGRVIAHIGLDAESVAALDHHQVWLSTVRRSDSEHGITIFAGRAIATGPKSLEVEGVVRLAEEPRRTAVRAPGCMVTLPPLGGRDVTVTAEDISRGGVRLPLDETGWPYDDPVDLVIHLDRDRGINVVARLVHVDERARTVSLRFDAPDPLDAAALDRYALSRLPQTSGKGAAAT